MRLGNVRVSRLALVGDPYTAALGFALGIGNALSARRGKVKRQAGGAVLVKSLTKPGAANIPSLPGLPGAGPAGTMGPQVSLPGQIGHTIGQALARGGRPAGTDAQGRPIFPVSVSKGRRRMNPLNPRALRRAISRVTSFSRFARRTVSIVQRVKLKKRRRR